MGGYAHTEMRRLETELAYMPARLRKGPVERMIRLIPELLSDRLYTYDYVFHRITRFHPDADGENLLSGNALCHDLGIILQHLSRESPFDAAAANGRVVSLEAIAARRRVTLRTVRRWALMGLPLCCYRFPDGSHAWGVRNAALEKFLAARDRKLKHSTVRVSDAEKRAILERVAMLERAGQLSPAAIVRQVCQESGRAPTTVRRLLSASRQAQAEARGKRKGCAGLAPAKRDNLVRRYRDGTPVRKLAKRFARSVSTIYRILHHALVEQILSLKIHYVPSPEFALPDAEAICLGEGGLFTFPPELTPDMPRAPQGLPPYLRDLYSVPLLTREREHDLFRKYNYIKYRMAMLQEQVRTRGYRARMIDRFEELRRAAEQLRRILIRCNLRLVVSVAKRHIGPLAKLMELVSEGNMCLIRTVECYDHRRNARFATYTTWALTKHFARVVPERNYRLHTFVTGRDELFALVGDTRPNPQERVETVAHLRSLLTRATRHLTKRERVIIESHYGTNGRVPRTLEEIGKIFGLTRERIRQIELRALGKLRDLIGPEELEAVT